MDRAQMYHDMTTAELKEKQASLKQELFNLRFQHTTGQLKNPLMLNTVKKDIARVMTILNERENNLPKNPGKKTAKKEQGKQEKKLEKDETKKKTVGGKK